MFTSRAEYRTLLRQDNADLRLTEKAYHLGLVKEDRLQAVRQKEQQTKVLKSYYEKTSITPEEANSFLIEKNSSPIKQSDKMAKIYSRPNITSKEMISIRKVATFIEEQGFSKSVQEQVEIQIKYAGYIEKEKLNADKLNRLEAVKIPSDFDYHALASLSHEAKEKLSLIQPQSISQASRISGINPSDISVLLVKLGR